MRILLYLPLLVPLAAALAGRPLAERLPPRTATWLLTVSAVALAGISWVVLGLLMLAAAVRIPLVDALGGISLRAIEHRDPASLPAGIAAAALLAAAAAAAARALWLRTTALIRAHREATALAGAAGAATGPAVIVAGDGVDAYTVPGWPARIVVTAGMMAALAPAEREVLLAHERAHAAGRHYLFMAAAGLAAAANPLLRPLAAALDYSVERWADERAAAVTGSRPLAARTVAKAALAAAAAPAARHGPAVAAGMVPAQQLPGLAGPVPRRVAALLRPPPRHRMLLVALTLALVAVAGLSALEAARDLHALIELAQAAALR